MNSFGMILVGGAHNALVVEVSECSPIKYVYFLSLGSL